MIQPGIIAASQGGAAPTPVTRAYGSAESLGEVVNADPNTWTAQGVSLTMTTGVAERWLVFWCYEVLGSYGDVTDAQVRITEDGVAVDTPAYRAVSGTEWFLQGGFFLHTGAGAAVTWAMDLRIPTLVFGPADAHVRGARISALRLAAADEYVESLAPQNNFTGSYADAAILSFTPATPGDYLVLGFGLVTTVTTATSNARLFDGSLGSADIVEGSASASEAMTVSPVWVKPALTGAQSIALQFHSTSIKSARIVALRLDGFTHAYRTTLTGDDSGADTSFADALALSRPVAARDFLAIAHWASSHSGAAEVVDSRLLDDISPVNANSALARHGGVGEESRLSVRIGAYAAGRRTWRIQRRSTVAGRTAVIKSGAVIAVLQLN